jgi:hypothetical protein
MAQSGWLILAGLLSVAVSGLAEGSAEEIIETQLSNPGAPITVGVTPGEHFLHRLKIMPLVSIKSPPQMAVWVETPEGEFIETLLVTSKIGRQEWRKAPGDPTPEEDIRRKEALPVWSYRHGVIYEDGLPVPTRENPMPDSVTTATPKKGFDLRTSLPDSHVSVVVYLEVNASTDFNQAYPAAAQPGSPGYSGGEWGSGQPSLVYSAAVHLDKPGTPIEMNPVGHGSPDGSNGLVYPDLSGLTTALSIIESSEVTVTSGEERSAVR